MMASRPRLASSSAASSSIVVGIDIDAGLDEQDVLHALARVGQDSSRRNRAGFR